MIILVCAFYCISFSFISVQLLIGKSTVAAGKVVERTKYVHNYELKSSEIRVHVTSSSNIEHPDYRYKLEPGSFVAWQAEDCRKMPGQRE